MQKIKLYIAAIIFATMFGLVSLISWALVIILSPLGWVEKSAITIILLAVATMCLAIIIMCSKCILAEFAKKQNSKK